MRSMLKISNIFERLVKGAALAYDNVLTEPMLITVMDNPSDENEMKFTSGLFSVIQDKYKEEVGERILDDKAHEKGVGNLLSVMGYDPDLNYDGEAVSATQSGIILAIFPAGYDKDAWRAAQRASEQQVAQQQVPEVTQRPTSLHEPLPAPKPAGKPSPIDEVQPKRKRKYQKRNKEEAPKEEAPKEETPLMDLPYGTPSDKPSMRLENVKRSPWHLGIEEMHISEEEYTKRKEMEQAAKRRPPHFSKRETPKVESVEEYIEIMEEAFVPGSISHGDHLVSAVLEKIIAENAAGGEGWIGSSILIVDLEGKEYIYHYQWDESPARYKHIGEPYIIRFPKRSAAQKKMKHEEWVENYKENIANKHKENVPILQRGTGDVGEVFKMIDGALSMWFEMDKETGSYRRISYSTIDTTREELQPFGFIIGTKMFEEGGEIVPGTSSAEISGEETRKQMTERKKRRKHQRSKKESRRAYLFKLTKIGELFDGR